MLVSHRHQFIFTKTRKTAGTSVESYFERFCMADGEWSESHARREYESATGIIGQRGHGPGQLWSQHMSAALIRDRLGAALWDRYYKFCIVRNPFDMVISLFYFRRGSGLLPPAPGQSDAEQFEQWIQGAALASDAPMYVIDGKIGMDFIGRYERLTTDLEAICGSLGLPWNAAALPGLKKGLRPAHARVASLHTERTKAVVQRVFAFELHTFGYTFEQALAAA